MKKIVSNTLYVLFFGFALTLVTACILLMMNASDGEGKSYRDIEAVMISGTMQDDAEYAPIDRKVLDVTDDSYTFVPIHYAYDALETDKKKELYHRLKESVYSVTNEADENGRYRISRITIRNHQLSEFDIREVVNAFIHDYPEIFWIENLFGYAYVDNHTIVEFYSVLSSDDCEKYISVFNQRVRTILDSVGKGRTEYEREKAIHDALLSNCSYKTGISSAADGWQYFTAYGALVEGEAVCEGYAKSMQLLLTRVGIPCSMIRGEAEGILHMWNVVELNGDWYHLDPTWDDNDKDGMISYEYFNLTTEGIGINHTISDHITTILETENSQDIDPLSRYNFYVPMCTSKSMNYYYVEGALVEDFDAAAEKTVVEALVRCAQGKKTYFPLRLGSKMTFSEYVDKLFYQSPYRFYFWIESANRRLDQKHQIDAGSVSLLKNETAMTLRIRLNYAG